MNILACRCATLLSLCLAVLADSPARASAVAVQNYNVLGADFLQRLSSLSRKYSFRIRCPYNEKIACIDDSQRDIELFKKNKSDIVFNACTQTSLNDCVNMRLDVPGGDHEMQVYWRRAVGQKSNIWLLEVSDGVAPPF